MQVEVDKKAKRVNIWLTKAEAANEQLKQNLIPFYQKCKANGCLAVVYKSGTEDLLELTRSLLIYNRYRCEELKMEKEAKAKKPVEKQVAG